MKKNNEEIESDRKETGYLTKPDEKTVTFSAKKDDIITGEGLH